MVFKVYDTDSPAGDVWLLNIISRVGVRNMIADSSEPNKVQVGNDQEMAQSERYSHFIDRGVGKKLK